MTQPSISLFGGVASLVAAMIGGAGWRPSSRPLVILGSYAGHDECAGAGQAMARADAPIWRVTRLGEGWVGETLAIAVYRPLNTGMTLKALIAAVNHSGDSDSTGAVTGKSSGHISV